MCLTTAIDTDFLIIGSKIRLVTLDATIDLLKGMVLGKNGQSYMADTHFAQLEGIKEESTLLLRNFYKAISDYFLHFFTIVLNFRIHSDSSGNS